MKAHLSLFFQKLKEKLKRKFIQKIMSLHFFSQQLLNQNRKPARVAAGSTWLSIHSCFSPSFNLVVSLITLKWPHQAPLGWGLPDLQQEFLGPQRNFGCWASYFHLQTSSNSDLARQGWHHGSHKSWEQEGEHKGTVRSPWVSDPFESWNTWIQKVKASQLSKMRKASKTMTAWHFQKAFLSPRLNST